MGAADTAKNRKNADRQTLLIYTIFREKAAQLLRQPRCFRKLQLGYLGNLEILDQAAAGQ
jgi:hypothetical protein